MADSLAGRSINSAYKPAINLTTIDALIRHSNMVVNYQKEIDSTGGDGNQFSSYIKKVR